MDDEGGTPAEACPELLPPASTMTREETFVDEVDGGPGGARHDEHEDQDEEDRPEERQDEHDDRGGEEEEHEASLPLPLLSAAGTGVSKAPEGAGEDQGECLSPVLGWSVAANDGAHSDVRA
eukprot:IDg17628t1